MPSWIIIGVATLVWIGCLTSLYRLAGRSIEGAIAWATGVTVGAGVAALLEYPLSLTTLVMYCNNTVSGAFGVQVAIGVILAMAVGSFIAWRMKPPRPDWQRRDV